MIQEHFIITVSRYLNVTFASFYLFFFVLFFIYYSKKLHPIRFSYPLLCLTSLLYCILTIIITYGDHSRTFAHVLILSVAGVGFFSFSQFCRVFLALFPKHREINWFSHIAILWSAIFLISIAEVLITGESWTTQPNPSSGPKNICMKLLFTDFTISNAGKAFLGLGSFLVLIFNAYLFKLTISTYPKEKLLIAGILTSILVNLNDNLLGLDIIEWAIPLAFSTFFFEIVRFHVLVMSGHTEHLKLLHEGLIQITQIKSQSPDSARHDLLKMIHAIQMKVEQSLKHDPTNKDLISGMQTLKDAVNRYMKHTELTSSEVNIATVVQTVTNILQAEMRQHSIEIAVNVPSTVTIKIAEIDFLLVCFNLLKNAIEALSTQEIDQKKITIKATKEGHNTTLMISDNGSTISKETQSKMFHAYFTTKTEHTGLGLSIVRDTLYRYKGIIQYHEANNGMPHHFAISFLNS